MLLYNVEVGGTLTTVTTALATLIASATRSILLLEVDIEGMGTTSTANELGLYRINVAGVTPSGALTVTPVHPSSPSFAGTAFSTYGTQPTRGALIKNMPFNGNGQRYFWRANPGKENAIVIPGGNNAAASVGLFTISGTAAFRGRLQIAEL
jgi:hypothetical protein